MCKHEFAAVWSDFFNEMVRFYLAKERMILYDAESQNIIRRNESCL